MNPERGSSAEWITVAVLGRPRGNRGELTATSLSDDPERFQNLEQVFLFGDGSAFRVERTWLHQGRLIFKFQGIDTISAAERLVGAEVRIPARRRAELEQGSYFQSDLLGCEVVEQQSGQTLGRVQAWQETGGTPLLELDTGLLVPFARAICVEIDPRQQRIVVELPAGLKELNEP